MTHPIRHDGGFIRMYKRPRLREPLEWPRGLSQLSARDAYLLKRSMERYERRPDKQEFGTNIRHGEVGRIESVRIITNKSLVR